MGIYKMARQANPIPQENWAGRCLCKNRNGDVRLQPGNVCNIRSNDHLVSTRVSNLEFCSLKSYDFRPCPSDNSLSHTARRPSLVEALNKQSPRMGLPWAKNTKGDQPSGQRGNGHSLGVHLGTVLALLWNYFGSAWIQLGLLLCVGSTSIPIQFCRFTRS